MRKIKRINSGKIAVKVSKTAIIREERGKPVYEDHVTTFKVTKKKNKFIIYELPRKANPIRRKTIKAKKKQKISDIVQLIETDKIKINRKILDFEGRTKDGKVKIYHTNYIARIKAFAQMVGLVQVYDNKTQNIDHFVGYARKRPLSRNDNMERIKSENEVINMAIAKYINTYGLTSSAYEDLTGRIISKRYIYRKKKIIT